MHSLETIIKRNEEAQKRYDEKEAKRIKEGHLTDGEWSKVLNVPKSEVHKLLWY